MSAPTILAAFYTFLLASATPLALFCFITAGFQLRQDGGTNYQTQGGFFKWIAWGAIFLTIPGIQAWLTAEYLPGASLATGADAAYTEMLAYVVHDFVYNVLLDKIAPLMAGALILKALLDAGEERSPFPSVISALFILGVGGFMTQAQAWSDSTPYATANLLSHMLNWAMTSVAPVLGGMAVYGAIIQFARGVNWLVLAMVGGGLLVVPSLWSLVKGWAGVGGTWF